MFILKRKFKVKYFTKDLYPTAQCPNLAEGISESVFLDSSVTELKSEISLFGVYIRPLSAMQVKSDHFVMNFMGFATK